MSGHKYALMSVQKCLHSLFWTISHYLWWKIMLFVAQIKPTAIYKTQTYAVLHWFMEDSPDKGRPEFPVLLALVLLGHGWLNWKQTSLRVGYVIEEWKFFFSLETCWLIGLLNLEWLFPDIGPIATSLLDAVWLCEACIPADSMKTKAQMF